MVIFFWGFKGYVSACVPPNDRSEIVVTAKKWVWQFEYPDGTRTLNDLHVPLNKRVKLVMHSEDVIHSFFVPTFRIKRDVIPGRYTELWFTANEPGIQQVFCAEYCGKGHSDMLARIFVDTPEQYETFLREGDEQIARCRSRNSANWSTKTRAAPPATPSTARAARVRVSKAVWGQAVEGSRRQIVSGRCQLHPRIDSVSAGRRR